MHRAHTSGFCCALAAVIAQRGIAVALALCVLRPWHCAHMTSFLVNFFSSKGHLPCIHLHLARHCARDSDEELQSPVEEIKRQGRQTGGEWHRRIFLRCGYGNCINVRVHVHALRVFDQLLKAGCRREGRNRRTRSSQ